MNEKRTLNEQRLAACAGGKKESRTVYRIDETKCISCGLCGKHCPVNAINASGGVFMTVSTSLCVGCGVCAGICPKEAIEAVQL